jgi:tetratricopeptide (TPR) repeat protein
MTDVASLFLQAFARHKAGERDAAAAGYRRVLADAPAHIDAAHLLGLVRREQGDPATAAILIGRALRLFPQFAQAWANQARALAEAGQGTQAATAAGFALTLDPGLPGVRRMRATLLTGSGDAAAAAGRPSEAAARYEAAARIDGACADALDRLMRLRAQSDLSGALEPAERLWLLSPDDDRRDNLWNLCVKAGPEIGAAACRDRVVGEPARSAAAWIAYGNALREETYGQGAEAAYRMAAVLRPGDPFAYGRLACLYVQYARHRQADALFRRVAARWSGREQAMRFDPAFIAAALAERRTAAALEPEGRYVAPDKPVLVAAGCDGAYFSKFASAMVHSTVRNAGFDAAFHLHVVNPPADLPATIDRWDERLGRPGIGFSTETLDAGALGAEAKTAYACARFRLLPALLRRYRRTVVLLDVDLIVLRDLRGLLAAVADADVAMVGGDHNRFEPWNLYWADVIVIRPTDAAVAYFDRVAAYIDYFLTRGVSRWFLDQIALTAVAACGFPDAPAPRIVRLPKDIHRMAIRYADGGDEEPPSTCLFWSAHASTVSTRLTLETPRFHQYVL